MCFVTRALDLKASANEAENNYTKNAVCNERNEALQTGLGCYMCYVLLTDVASKHAAQAFFDCLRAEVEEYGIVVSTISHTFINASEPPPAAEPAPKQNILTNCEYDANQKT